MSNKLGIITLLFAFTMVSAKNSTELELLKNRVQTLENELNNQNASTPMSISNDNSTFLKIKLSNTSKRKSNKKKKNTSNTQYYKASRNNFVISFNLFDFMSYGGKLEYARKLGDKYRINFGGEGSYGGSYNSMFFGGGIVYGYDVININQKFITTVEGVGGYWVKYHGSDPVYRDNYFGGPKVRISAGSPNFGINYDCEVLFGKDVAVVMDIGFSFNF